MIDFEVQVKLAFDEAHRAAEAAVDALHEAGRAARSARSAAARVHKLASSRSPGGDDLDSRWLDRLCGDVQRSAYGMMEAAELAEGSAHEVAITYRGDLDAAGVYRSKK
jgi:hypothetical protein